MECGVRRVERRCYSVIDVVVHEHTSRTFRHNIYIYIYIYAPVERPPWNGPLKATPVERPAWSADVPLTLLS